MSLKTITKKLLPKSILNLRHLFYAWLGSVIYRRPSEKMYVIGVTGTSGKSSVVYFLRQLLENSGYKVGALSTIEFCVAEKCRLNDKKMTMLGKIAIQKYLRQMADEGCNIAIVETTSEGRVQHRHQFINYDMMVLTNLYSEHIESHGSFENYKQAKLDIFEYVSKCEKKKLCSLSVIPRSLKATSESRRFESESRDCKGTLIPLWRGDGSEEPRNDIIGKIAVVNNESEYKDEFLKFNFEKKIGFGKGGEFAPMNSIISENGIGFNMGSKFFSAKLFGQYNIMNISAVIAVARALGIDWDTILKAVNGFEGVPGRIEFIPEAVTSGFQVIVDYAFEPVAMAELYKVAKMLKPRKIIHVFGSTGGGRDADRRAKLGDFIGKNADICLITDEDPYDDNPQEIIDEVAKAVEQSGKEEGEDLFKILDRGEAIRKAVSLSQKDDLILITGKGSEQAMVVKGKLIPWDDRTAVREALRHKT
ncbi:MAG: hypothetical protein A2224_02115 [Candidatus Magasanikbacteria bacterium RIFOXYA2_FULL_40_20]|nr:MAG: hypothetical protein A2224_02115 [Candidatus Magasanikbacteria bacterium RIFOXYA2_FULL_40_20]